MTMLTPTLTADPRTIGTRATQTVSNRGALAGLSLSLLLSSLGTSVATVALPTLAEVFGNSFRAVQWVILTYLLAITASIVGVGRLGDLFGRRRLLLTGIVTFTVASAACGLAPQLGLLLAARAAQGLGAAAIMALTLAVVRELVPPEKVGGAIGLLGTMSAVGTALGPVLGGFLLSTLGWRSIFLINLPLGMLAWLLILQHLADDVPERAVERPRIDLLGTALLAVTLTAFALAVTIGRDRFGLLNVSLLLAAAFGLVLFLRTEARADSPVVPLTMFRDHRISASLAMSALVATVLMSTLVIGPFYLSRALGLEAAQLGLVLSVGPLVAAMVGVPAGRLVDRLGAPRVTVVGLLGVAGACTALTLLPSKAGVAGYLVPMMLLTGGYGLFQAANNTQILNHVRREHRGVTSGLLNLSRNFGLVIGASVMGAVFAVASATTDGSPARPEMVAAATRVTFAVATALSLIALVLALRLRTLPPRFKFD